MNMMMNHTRYLQKQVAMMQASAIQQQFTGVMTPPAPQMMPNSTSRSSSFSGPCPPAGNPLMYQPTTANFGGNPADPFLSAAPLRNGKINLNTPTPMRAAISRLPNDQQQQQQTILFDYPNEYDSVAVGSSNPIESSASEDILSDYLNGTSAAFIDPSTIMNLHEYLIN